MIIFTLDDLEGLVKQASQAAAEAPNPGLSHTFRALAEAADSAHAALFRTLVLSSAMTPEEALEEVGQEGPQEPAEGLALLDPIEAASEDDEAPRTPLTDEEAAMARKPVFIVRPRSSKRLCSICEQPQWKSPSGWSCKNKHLNAAPLEDASDV